jgi:hypothetical protein
LTYSFPVWGYAADTYINKLQTFENKVLRIITKFPIPIVTLHEQIIMSCMISYQEVSEGTVSKACNQRKQQIQEL